MMVRPGTGGMEIAGKVVDKAVEKLFAAGDRAQGYMDNAVSKGSFISTALAIKAHSYLQL